MRYSLKDKYYQQLKERVEDKLFNFRPLLFTFLFIAIGVLFAYFYLRIELSPIWCIGLLPILATPFFFRKNKYLQTFMAVLVLATGFIVGVIGLNVQVNLYCKNKDVHSSVIEGTVYKTGNQEDYFAVMLENVRIHQKNFYGKVVAYLPKLNHQNIEITDVLLVYGDLQVNTKNNFNPYYLNEKVIGVIITDDFSIVGKKYTFFSSLRYRLQKVIRQGMDKDVAEVALGVLTGNTDGMEYGLLTNMRRGGIAHIFAVSGLHMGALYSFCLKLIQKTRLRKTPKLFRFVFMALLLIFYGGICGYSPSVIRAIVMCLCFYMGNLTGKRWDLLESIGLAGCVVLLIQPASLFEVGFQLSFGACFGIALFSKPLEDTLHQISNWIKVKIFKRSLSPITYQTQGHPPTVLQRLKRNAVSLITASLSAQMATFPICLSAFGYFSGWGLVLNFIFVPFISAVFSVLLVFVLIACVVPLALSNLILLIPNVVSQAVMLLFYAFDFSNFALENITIRTGMILCYYLSLLFLTDKLNISKSYRYSLFFCCVLGLLVCFLIGNI